MAQGTAIESSVALDNPDPPPVDVEVGDDGANGAEVLDPAIEARAREMGWKPYAEYKGPPGKWQDAAAFIERGENILPIVRDQNRRLTERVGKLEGQITTLTATASEQLQIIKDLRDMGRNADQRGYDRAMADIKAKQRLAVESGDTKAYDQLVEQAQALQGSRAAVTPAAEPPAPAKPAEPRPAMSAEVQRFIGENSWFNSEKLLGDAMINYHQKVLNERQVTQADLNADPALDRELLQEAKRRVVERFPEYFDQPAPRRQAGQEPRRRAPPVTPPSGDVPQPRSNGAANTINSISDLTERAEARQAFERIKRNLPDYTEAEYMALYVDPHSDVLAIQQQKATRQPNGR